MSAIENLPHGVTPRAARPRALRGTGAYIPKTIAYKQLAVNRTARSASARQSAHSGWQPGGRKGRAAPECLLPRRLSRCFGDLATVFFLPLPEQAVESTEFWLFNASSEDDASPSRPDPKPPFFGAAHRASPRYCHSWASHDPSSACAHDAFPVGWPLHWMTAVDSANASQLPCCLCPVLSNSQKQKEKKAVSRLMLRVSSGCGTRSRPAAVFFRPYAASGRRQPQFAGVPGLRLQQSACG